MSPHSPISELVVRMLRVPLSRPWGADVTSIAVIEVVVTTRDGEAGTGFSWTPTIGAHSVVALLEHDIRDRVIGETSDPRALWPLLWAHLHEAGSGGITTIAMAGLDLALWDLQARRSGSSLSDFLGSRRDEVPVYGSGVNLHYPLDELVAQAQRWRDSGYHAVKIKVGRPELSEDIDRVAAVREAIGPELGLMIDANQRWSLEKAETAMHELARFSPAWIEEPLRADDLVGHAELRSRIETPIALGENLHTLYRFREAIDTGACDIIQPNVVRVGGITPFLEIASLAAERGVPLRPHLLPEISGQLARALESPTIVEDVEDASFESLGLLAEPAPVRISGGTLTATGRAGLGLTFTDTNS